MRWCSNSFRNEKECLKSLKGRHFLGPVELFLGTVEHSTYSSTSLNECSGKRSKLLQIRLRFLCISAAIRRVRKAVLKPKDDILSVN